MLPAYEFPSARLVIRPQRMTPKIGLITCSPQLPVSTRKALPDTPGFLVAPWALLALLAAFKKLFGLLIKYLGTGSRCATELYLLHSGSSFGWLPPP